MRNMLTELASFGQASMLVPVVYRYMEMLDPKAAVSSKTPIEVVVPAKESEAQLTEKKNMLSAFSFPCVSVAPGSTLLRILLEMRRG